MSEVINGIVLSNELAALAEDVAKVIRESDDAAKLAAGKAIEAGHILCEAKEACGYGHWLPFLKRAGINERRAQRLMKLARSGMKSDTVSYLGGVTAALRHISHGEMPGSDHALLVKTASALDDAVAIITESQKRGFYHVCVLRGNDDGTGTALFTKLPVWGTPVSSGIHWVWLFVCRWLKSDELEPVKVPRAIADDILAIVRYGQEFEGVFDDNIAELQRMAEATGNDPIIPS